MRRIMFLVICCMAFVSGCGGIKCNTESISFARVGAIDHKKLVFDSQRRVWLYDQKAVYSAGIKATDKDQVIILLNTMNTTPESSSLGRSINSYFGAAIIVPAALIVGIPAGILTSPFISIDNKLQVRDSYKRYRTAKELLKKHDYANARQKYYEALYYAPDLAACSDVYYQIAETYDSQGMADSARFYYRAFLEKSLDLYPLNFEKYDPKYKNDLNILDAEFTKAEDKLGIKREKISGTE